MPATVDIQNDIATITMDDGKANAINPTMLEALHKCLDEAEKNAKALVITGREGRFSAGFDLKMFASGTAEEVKALVDRGGLLAHRLFSFPMPVIAACNGHGIAMGSFILLSCDVRIGTSGPFKVGANETTIHMVVPEWAAHLMQARLTPAALTQSGVFGQLFDPDGAIGAGYLDEVTDADKVLATATGYASALAPLSGTSLTGNKHLFRKQALEAMRASVPSTLSLY